MAHAARDEQRLPRLQAQPLPGLEFQVDPALQGVDELAVADVIMPPGRLCHAGDRRHHLGAHRAVAGVGDAQIPIGEELPPSWDEWGGLLRGMVEPHGRFLCRVDRGRHVGPPLDVPRIGRIQLGNITAFFPSANMAMTDAVGEVKNARHGL